MFSVDSFLRLNAILSGAWRLAYLNLLWIATTVLGLVVFGIGPATYAVAAYVDRYVAEVPGVWASRTPELAAVITGSGLPSTLIHPPVLERTAPLVDDPADPGQRPTVLARRAAVSRALATRPLV